MRILINCNDSSFCGGLDQQFVYSFLDLKVEYWVLRMKLCLFTLSFNPFFFLIIILNVVIVLEEEGSSCSCRICDERFTCV